MKKPTVPHAISRALERYGLKISYDDLLDLCLQCKEGKGRLGYMPDGKERHLLLCHGKAVVAIYMPYDGVNVFQPNGRIITLLPKAAATPLGRLPHLRKRRLLPKGKPPKKARNKRWMKR